MAAPSASSDRLSDSSEIPSGDKQEQEETSDGTNVTKASVCDSNEQTTSVNTHPTATSELGEESEKLKENTEPGSEEKTEVNGLNPITTNTETPSRSADLNSDECDDRTAAVLAADTRGQEEGATALPDTRVDKAPLQSVYHVKWINFRSDHVAIVTQNENGPCPLLAIANVLLLQGKIKLPGMVEMVTSGQLMEYLGDCIFTNKPKDLNADNQLNWEQNMSDAVTMFHKLQTGLDVNVRFTGVNEFEYTNEMLVFDLLGMQLFHGWLVDPESVTTAAAVGSCTYNQLVEKIISQKTSDRPEMVAEALEAEQFLEKSSHQLTYYGLSELVSKVKEEQLCVFFRNNHFSTLYKHKNELFLLVTDQGFLTESNVVWETLSNVEGDGNFVDANFTTYRKPEPSTAPISTSGTPCNSPEQLDQDYLLAMSLQQEQQEQSLAWQQITQQNSGGALSDQELAMRLQEEENRRLIEAQQSQSGAANPHQGQARQAGPSRQPQAAADSGKKSDCAIL